MSAISLEARSPEHPADMRLDRKATALERALDVWRSAFHAIVDSCADGVVVVNLNGTICFVNEAAERLLGRKMGELLGEPLGIEFVVGQRSQVRLDEDKPAEVVEVWAVATEWQGHAAHLVTLHDVTHLKRAEEAVRLELRQRDDFLATLSHELRNPLAAISHAAQVMKRAGHNAKLTEQGREIVERQCVQMTQLLDDLLDVARASRGRIEVNKECLNLNEVLTEAADAVAVLMRQRKHQLVVQVPHEPLFVDGDPVRLHQVFVNLLSNAAKYTDLQGHVWLTLGMRNDEALVTVRDDGIGMPPEVQRAIFEPFVQIRTTLNRSEGGLGIGLSLVKSLVELHGGRVVASSAGTGMGSEFRVWLPLSADRPAVATAAPTSAAGSGLRILLVEDNADVRQMLQLAIELDGHDVAAADDGKTALELLEFQRPDVAIIDIGLPDFDGYELARIIRAHPSCSGIRLLAVTGHGSASHQQRALAAGFDAHLAKPVDLDELLAALVACTKTGRLS